MAAAAVDNDAQLAQDEEFARRLQREEFNDIVAQYPRSRPSENRRHGDISAPLLDNANPNPNGNDDNANANNPNAANRPNGVSYCVLNL